MTREDPEMLLTTIAGSLPKPAWLAEPRTLWAPWRLSGAALAEGKRDAVLIALREQEAAGIDIVTDGEQSRQHFVHGFLEHVDGVDFSRRVTIGIRADRYKAEVPTVTGPLVRRRPGHAADVAFARAHTTRKLKFTIPGPMTIVDTLADEHYRDRRRLALEFARVINEEARELVALGLDVLQLDEPAFNVYMDDVAAWGIETPEEVAATIRGVMAFVPPERLYPCTNCGMVPLARDVARGKLRALAAGAAIVRRELGVG